MSYDGIGKTAATITAVTVIAGIGWYSKGWVAKAEDAHEDAARGLRTQAEQIQKLTDIAETQAKIAADQEAANKAKRELLAELCRAGRIKGAECAVAVAAPPPVVLATEAEEPNS